MILLFILERNALNVWMLLVLFSTICSLVLFSVMDISVRVICRYLGQHWFDLANLCQILTRSHLVDESKTLSFMNFSDFGLSLIMHEWNVWFKWTRCNRDIDHVARIEQWCNLPDPCRKFIQSWLNIYAEFGPFDSVFPPWKSERVMTFGKVSTPDICSICCSFSKATVSKSVRLIRTSAL